jgi:hypothetical protein
VPPDCFNFPDVDYSATNFGQKGGWVSVTTGMKAPDFTLSTVDGEAQTLSTLLKSKPVLLEFGAWT